jgi:hypothetical protein
MQNNPKLKKNVVWYEIYIYIITVTAFFLHVWNIIQDMYNKTSSIVLVSPLISSNDCAKMDVPGLMSDNV